MLEKIGPGAKCIINSVPYAPGSLLEVLAMYICVSKFVAQEPSFVSLG